MNPISTTPGAANVTPEQRAEAQRIATDLQAVFVQEMLKAMRETVPDSEFSGSDGEKTFEMMFDQNLASSLSEKMGKTGITEALEKQIMGLMHRVRTDSAGGAQ